MNDVMEEDTGIGCNETGMKAPVSWVSNLSSESDSHVPVCHDSEDSDFSGWTPLMRACRNGQTNLVVQLLSSGATPTERDALGWNAVPLAVASGNIATIKEILKGVKWNQKELAPALCLAALNGLHDVAELLLTSRANANEPIENSGVTPLMLAAGEGLVEMVTLLLEHNADPDMTNALHQTALDASVVRNHIAVQNVLGPVTHLRSKLSSHIPLPVSPPNRALQSPSHVQPDIRFLDSSLFVAHCHNHSPMGYNPMGYNLMGSSPMLNCTRMLSPVCASFCGPSGNLLASSPVLKNEGFMSPLPASYTSLVYPYEFPRITAPTSPYPYPGSCQNVCGSYQNISSEGGLNPNSVAKGNKRLRKWWCEMKRRCKGDRSDCPGDDKSVDVTMEKRLTNFLRSIKMTEYQPLFKTQEVDFEMFLTLTNEDLKEIGVKNPVHRAKIVEKIEKFSKNATVF